MGKRQMYRNTHLTRQTLAHPRLMPHRPHNRPGLGPAGRDAFPQLVGRGCSATSNSTRSCSTHEKLCVKATAKRGRGGGGGASLFGNWSGHAGTGWHASSRGQFPLSLPEQTLGAAGAAVVLGLELPLPAVLTLQLPIDGRLKRIHLSAVAAAVASMAAAAAAAAAAAVAVAR